MKSGAVLKISHLFDGTARTWQDDLHEVLDDQVGEEEAAELDPGRAKQNMKMLWRAIMGLLFGEG